MSVRHCIYDASAISSPLTLTLWGSQAHSQAGRPAKSCRNPGPNTVPLIPQKKKDCFEWYASAIAYHTHLTRATIELNTYTVSTA